MALLRYDLNAGSRENTSDHLLEIWAYEARRLFRDRIVGADNQSKFDNMLMSVIRSDWSANIFENIDSKLVFNSHGHVCINSHYIEHIS